MELNSKENIRLFRNCIAIEKAMPSANPDTINNYTNLFYLLTSADNPKEVLDTQDGHTADFGNYILSTPGTEILENYISLTKPYINDPIDFERFKAAMYRDFSNAYSPSKENLIASMQLEINQLDKLFKKYRPTTISPTQFKSFALQFRDISKNIGQAKFQEYFIEKGQTISHMLISDDDNYYRIVFTLFDKNNEKTNRTFTESIPAICSISTYIQNLCYSYIEANKFANTHTDLINQDIIKKQMNIFIECYEKFVEMINLKMNIQNNKIFFSADSNFVPENIPEVFEGNSI